MKPLTKKLNQVLTLLLTIAALMVGQSAWAASVFTIDASYNSNTHKTTFTITRTGNTTVAETIDWRVVSLSAIAGQHFTVDDQSGYDGTATFSAGTSTASVTIRESTPGNNAYMYQNGSTRKYRFEVLDKNGDILASKDRTITSGLTQFSAAKVSSSISNLVTMSSGNFSSGMSSSKYVDVSYSIPSSYVYTGDGVLNGYVLIDDEYDYAQKPATVSTSTLISSTGAPASYLNSLGYKIYATVCYTAQERDDGYQYIQIIAGDANHSYDGADPEKGVNDPSSSLYKVCYELSDGSDQGQGKAYFPHRGTGTGEFSCSDGKLWEQKYKSGTSGSGTGCIILNPTVSDITTRFDAGGKNNDTWGYKDFFVRMALCDATAPTVLSTNGYVVSGGHHQKGNTIYVSVAFGEIVTITGSTKKLITSWGDLAYEEGSGTNVLTFKGEIGSSASGTLKITGMSGTINDLAGNSFSNPWSSNNKDLGTVLDADYAWSTSDFNQLETKTYEIYTTLDMRHLALMVNSGNNNCSGLTFRQTHDITYTHKTEWDDATSTENNYIAIGTYNDPFNGTFDGQNHTISGIRLYKGGDTYADNKQGLFGQISYGTVKGVNLSDTRITGADEVGGIAGAIFETTIKDCTVAADVCIHAVQSSSDHGGIVGYNQSTVQRCLSRARLTVTDASDCEDYGAIVGKNQYGDIKDCIVIGATVPNVDKCGAIIGYHYYQYSGNYIQRNYYRGCTVAGLENATGVGVGYEGSSTSPHDVTANQGAQALYAVTLPIPASVVRTASATLPGTGNKTYTTGADIEGTPYAYATATLSLSYDAAAIPDGYDVLLSVTNTVGGGAVTFTDHGNHTYTISMPAADITVNATGATKDIYVSSGTMELVNDNGTWTASFSDSSTETVNIPTNITVDNVSLNRTFTADKAATLMLPFAIDVANTSGAKFYTYTGVTFDTETNKWKATMTQVESGTIAANTPYVVMPTDAAITFTGSVTLNTTTNSQQTTNGDWTFKGTYETKTWTAGDVGNDYGFAATSGKATDGVTDIEAGDFVKLAAGAWIRPMRSYLTYTGGGNPFAAPKHRAGTELPQSISVVLVNSDGTTTEIETTNFTNQRSMAEGKINYTDSDMWFTLDGRKLDKQPTQKGMYINNGKKVVIK